MFRLTIPFLPSDLSPVVLPPASSRPQHLLSARVPNTRLELLSGGEA